MILFSDESVSRHPLAGKLMTALRKSNNRNLEKIWETQKRAQIERRQRHASR